MINKNQEKINYIDMTPIVKTDIFVNDDYKAATISNIGRYLESPDIEGFQKRAKERLDMIYGTSNKIYE